MTDEQYKKLAKLVTYLLESEDWKCIWLGEYSEPVRLFTFKTGITFRRTKKYIDKALNKLLGPVYYETQSKLKRKVCEQSDLLFRPKPKISQSHNTHHNAGRTLVPWSEFGRKYLEHYRLSEVLKTKLNMPVKEKSIKKQGMLRGKLKFPNNGYLSVKVSKPKRKDLLVHILVWETFNGEIPQGYEIDHIKGNKEDNRLEMLRCVTHHENVLNPVTRNKISVSLKGRTPANKGKTFSEFGEKFKEHFGISRYENIDLYRVEYKWYIRHNNRCSWE